MWIHVERNNKYFFRCKKLTHLSKLKDTLKEDGWNDYLVRCKGKKHELFINGVKVATYTEEQDFPSKGVIGLQLHSGGIAKVEFKDITLKPL